MDKNQKKDLKKNLFAKDKKSDFIMINGRTISIEEYKKNPTYYNNLPIESNYLKRVQDDYENNH